MSKPLEPGGDLTVQMLFERYYASGLGRFRFSITTVTDPPPALPIPLCVQEDWLRWKGLSLEEKPDSAAMVRVRSRLKNYYLETTPKLKE